MQEELVAEIWRKRKAWATAARGFQAETSRARKIQLALIVVGSVCATAAATGVPLANDPSGAIATENRIVAAFGAVCLSLVVYIQQHFLSIERSERWPRARSVSEAIKSEVFKFRTGAHPYDASSPEQQDQPMKKLLDAVEAHVENASDLLPFVQPNEETAVGAPPSLDAEGYLQHRLKEQVEGYYLPAAQKHLRGAQRARFAGICLTLAGVVIAALMSSGLLVGAGAWVSVLTTVSAAIATFSSINRYDILASAYAKQANRLARLRLNWLAGTYEEWSQFVAECEETISAENRAWMAEMLNERETLAGVLQEKN